MILALKDSLPRRYPIRPTPLLNISSNPVYPVYIYIHVYPKFLLGHAQWISMLVNIMQTRFKVSCFKKVCFCRKAHPFIAYCCRLSQCLLLSSILPFWGIIYRDHFTVTSGLRFLCFISSRRIFPPIDVAIIKHTRVFGLNPIFPHLLADSLSCYGCTKVKPTCTPNSPWILDLQNMLSCFNPKLLDQ